ncbi:DUF6233 domain-containing protein [Streptomyces sp. NPDC001933]|uniref:DUF6233 domain-containing protein n=1 Tax=Streptomyces sp. NPDC001933 TaxID=3364626 RepID=UPI0036C7AC2B
MQPQRSSSAALVHRGDCVLYPVEGGFLTREEAVIALAEPDIEACFTVVPVASFFQRGRVDRIERAWQTPRAGWSTGGVRRRHAGADGPRRRPIRAGRAALCAAPPTVRAATSGRARGP